MACLFPGMVRRSEGLRIGLGLGIAVGLGLGLGTGIADLNLTYLRLLSTQTYHISYGGPEPLFQGHSGHDLLNVLLVLTDRFIRYVVLVVLTQCYVMLYGVCCRKEKAFQC